jgi:hypothetical protein
MFPLPVDTFEQHAYVKASNTGASDMFACSLAVSGDTLVIGAPEEASGSTGVGGNQADNSAPSSGAVYVFVRSGASWTQQAYLKASNTGAADWFGQSVALDGDTLVVGAGAEDSSATGVNGNELDESAPNAGAAYVFVRSGGIWSQQAYIKASNTSVGDHFGCSVALSGATLLVGAADEDSVAPDSGAAYVFVRNGGVWSQQAWFKASNPGAGDEFGASVSLSGDMLAVGALWEDSSATGINGNQLDESAQDSGAAYVFTRSGATWSQAAYLKASNTGANDRFGSCVALSNSSLVVGAPLEASVSTGVNGNQNDESAPNSGAAYVFVQNGGSWSQQAYLKASNTDAFDGFGNAAALDGETLVVAAHFERSSATGVDGDQSDDSALHAGAAYVFVRSGTSWSQAAYLKASNTQPTDEFGGSPSGNPVALADDTIAIGAIGEDSGATGVDGDQTDNSAPNSGAAYVFLRSGGSIAQICPGDGSAAACPCGNSGAPGHGCENSAATGGARLAATGIPVVANDTLQLTSSGELPSALSIVLQGTSRIAPVAFGDGLRCTGGLLKRLYVKTAVNGIVRAPQSGDPSVSARSAALGDPLQQGAARCYQVYYRDPDPGFCPGPMGATYSISSGVQVVWG